MSDTTTGAPLAGLISEHPIARKRLYSAYALVALGVSFAPDVVVAGILTAQVNSTVVVVAALVSSVLLKIGVAFGFVAASNVTGS